MARPPFRSHSDLMTLWPLLGYCLDLLWSCRNIDLGLQSCWGLIWLPTTLIHITFTYHGLFAFLFRHCDPVRILFWASDLRNIPISISFAIQKILFWHAFVFRHSSDLLALFTLARPRLLFCDFAYSERLCNVCPRLCTATLMRPIMNPANIDFRLPGIDLTFYDPGGCCSTIARPCWLAWIGLLYIQPIIPNSCDLQEYHCDLFKPSIIHPYSP